ncbi:Hypothetical protein R9X50_00448300 [Acrodontium crateriforme]|uniref:Uncharacterized protein n=1 Tax=Acrodontium crateriforme TaxID=150365 RepID=A0AAQ3RCS6_9PEZI|nr:Hypothetical protein R9X50_00448300 [Acrodontium crateriforme]
MEETSQINILLQRLEEHRLLYLDTRAKTTHGYAYDPFAHWKIIHLQCYPDWKASTDIHDSTKHYVNGVEAFMVSLLGEFRDCQKRFQEIYDRITRLITPPLDFMFNATIRDKPLFQDAHFIYSRRYFWAYQSLGIVNDSIKASIDAYEDTVTPEDSERSMYYEKKMASLKKKFEIEINNLRIRMSDNHKRRIEIRGLREELYTGTSIQESRKSVENTEITIQQGHNIKLLTLVSIFLLPLTFVTSVFGMSNIDQHEAWSILAIVTVTICVPFFVLIGSLNTTRVMHFWRQRTRAALDRTSDFFTWISRGGKKKAKDPMNENAEDDLHSNGGLLRRSTGTSEGMAMRLRGRPSMSRLSVQSLDTKSSSRLPQLAQ